MINLICLIDMYVMPIDPMDHWYQNKICDFL